MRGGRTAQGPQRVRRHMPTGFVAPTISIPKRPAEADERATPGHWRCRLIIRVMGQSAIGTFAQRASRFVTLVQLPLERAAESMGG